MLRLLAEKRVLAGLVMFGLSGVASAMPTFYNTGEGLPDYARDSHWKVEKVQGGSPIVGTIDSWVMDQNIYPVIGAYRRAGYSNSKWITISQYGYCANDDIMRFTQTLELPGGYGGNNNHNFEMGQSGFTLTGFFSSDNASELYVNGHLITGLPYYGPLGYSFQAIQTFDATPYLKQGTNSISFLVGAANTMGANVGPVEEWMGLRVEGTLGVVPEPATFACLGLGAAALLRRRKR